MLSFYSKYAYQLGYDQNGEGGILREIFNRIGKPKLVAEWGANDGEFCSNTRDIIEDGAQGIWMEYDEDLYFKAKEVAEELDVEVYYTAVTPDNVNSFITDGVDMVSIDTDGQNDYNTWKALTAKPATVVIEINSGYLPMEDRVEEGANYSAMVKLGIEKGYFLVCHTGNLIFVDTKYRDLFPDVMGNGLSNYQDYFINLWQS